MATIYRKTDKGRAEIETRAFRVPPRLRNALILVDGQRSSDDLCKMILQQAEETLAALAADGFIEAIAAAPAPVPPARPAAVPTGTAPTAAAPLPRANAVNFETRRRDVVRALTDLVGPVSESLALKMEKARDEAGLRPLLDAARQLVENTRGTATASSFAARYISE